jgi:hypothetical protein
MLGSNVQAIFRGFTYNEAWGAIDVTYEIDGKQLRHRYFPPKASSFKTQEQAEYAFFQKLWHHLEVYGVTKEEVSISSSDVKEFFSMLAKAAKPHLGKEVYIKTVKKGDYARISDWFPFVSYAPDMEYNEKEGGLPKPEEDVKVHDAEEFDDLPF